MNEMCGYEVISMVKRSKSGRGSSEQIKKRLQNSLPWSLSRLLASLWKKKK
ncbi:MAG: hypothetical protein PHF94_05225 [Methanothrix sp.]|nr:hypothetical protein [Methanothrix sp.]